MITRALCLPFTPAHVFVGFVLQNFILILFSGEDLADIREKVLLQFQVLKIFNRSVEFILEVEEAQDILVFAVSAKLAGSALIFRAQAPYEGIFYIGEKDSYEFDPTQIMFSLGMEASEVRLVPVEVDADAEVDNG